MQIEAFNDLPKNDQKRLVKRIKKACWTLQDVHSQEFVCGNDKIKRWEITFKLAAKGWASAMDFVLKWLYYARNGFHSSLR